MATPVDHLREKKERKLHIGGKEKHPEWEIFEALDNPLVDHCGNALDLSRFADSTFTAVYASHVLEHFAYGSTLSQALKEWARVLKPAGKLYISVPDLGTLCALFLAKEHLTLDERFHVMRMIYGGQTTAYDYHYVGFDFEILSQFLKSVGFNCVQRVERFDIFQDTSTLVFANIPISLNIIAWK